MGLLYEEKKNQQDATISWFFSLHSLLTMHGHRNLMLNKCEYYFNRRHKDMKLGVLYKEG